jgi:hypothetical protein
MAQFAPLVTGRAIVSVVEIAAQFPAVMRDSRIITSEVAPIAPRVVRKHRACSHSDQQQDPGNCAFHSLFSFQ